jgi:hypothetical protein
MATSYYPTSYGNANINALTARRGVLNDETGIIVQSISQTFTPKNDTLEDKDGKVVGLARLIDMTRKIEISGIVNGNTNLGSTNLNFVTGLTVAGRVDYHGFGAAFPIFIEDVSYDESNNAWRGIKISAMSYLGVTA